MSTSSKITSLPDRSRFAGVQRLYFYLVALISLILCLVALDQLFDIISEMWLGEPALYTANTEAYVRNSLASSGGLLLVAAPIFLIHWAFIQRRRSEPGAVSSVWRKLFLYITSAVSSGYILVSGYTLLRGAARLALGIPLASVTVWPSEWLHLTLTILLNVGLWFYVQRIIEADGDYGRESGGGDTVRRLYQSVAGLVGLGLLIFGGARILECAWQAIVDLVNQGVSVDWWRSLLSDGIAMVLLGGMTARINWRRWETILRAEPLEASTVLRRFFLYASVVLSALTALVPLAFVLRKVLLYLFDTGAAPLITLFDGLAGPFSFIPIGVAAWVWHWRYLAREVRRYGERPESATVRRLYFYTVAAVGLVLFWLGAVDALSAVLDLLLIDKSLEPGVRIWAAPLATGLSLLAVGAPVWVLHWNACQQIAHLLGALGDEERSSGPRRVYLYGVVLVAALVILFFLARVVYRLLLLLMGDPDANLFSIETANDIARSVVAAVFWLVHVWAIREDSRITAERPRPEPAPVVEDRMALEQRIAYLETELAATRAALAELDG